jgi:hypothetical protein
MLELGPHWNFDMNLLYVGLVWLGMLLVALAILALIITKGKVKEQNKGEQSGIFRRHCILYGNSGFCCRNLDDSSFKSS